MAHDRNKLLGLAKRLLTHNLNGTTDQADGIMVKPVADYTDNEIIISEVNKIFYDHPVPIALSPEFKEKKLIAFAGLGFNKKFFDQLKSENLNLVLTKEFPDHHQYTIDDIFLLLDQANKNDAFLVTTEKDHVRIPNEFKSSVGIIYLSLIHI